MQLPRILFNVDVQVRSRLEEEVGEGADHSEGKMDGVVDGYHLGFEEKVIVSNVRQQSLVERSCGHVL